MLRSPAHLIGPTATATATSDGQASRNGTNSYHHHHHHHHNHRSHAPTRPSSIFDSCHRKIRLIGGGPVAFLEGLVAKARRKERDGDDKQSDTKLYLKEAALQRNIADTIPDTELRSLVELPNIGIDYCEWLASHTLALFGNVNLIYGTVSEFCTPLGCPEMNGPGNKTYLWYDERGKKYRVPASQYIDYVMTYIQRITADESVFPTKYGNEFPESAAFEAVIRKILRLLFHVIAHLYEAHFREVLLLKLHPHLNLTFAHLTILNRRFNLIDPKETVVLSDLEVALRLVDDTSNSSSSSLASLPGIIQNSNNFNNSNNSLTNYLSNNNCSSTESVTTSVTTTTTTVTTQAVISSGTLIDGDALSQPIVKQPETGSQLPSPLKSPIKVTFCGESVGDSLNSRTISSNRLTAIE